jgi:hypothetical protein
LVQESEVILTFVFTYFPSFSCPTIVPVTSPSAVTNATLT